MRVCIRKFFKKDTTEYIRVRTAYFGKSECLEHVNNRQLWVHSPSLENILYLQTSLDSPDMLNLAYNSGFPEMGQSHLHIFPDHLQNYSMIVPRKRELLIGF